MASSKGEEAAPPNINPLLLASARVGSWEALDLLFEGRGAQDPQMMIPTEEFLAFLTRAQTRLPVSGADVEQGVYRQPISLAARELLQGVTPGGDTALHAVASNGDGQDFVKYAGMICGRDSGLLFAKNHRGDTPLHSAARAGNSAMVSQLIVLAGREGDHKKLKLLRMENTLKETALHEAVRFEDGRLLGPKDRDALLDADGAPEEHKIREFVGQLEGMTIVKQLMGHDSKLANYPADGISPLYLAILLNKSTIAVTIYHESAGNLSYSGADGVNALHIAVLQSTNIEMIELLLHWNKSLTAEVDKDGSTPLHFVRFTPIILEKVFKTNPTAVYQADKNGFYPIHVAGSVDDETAIEFLLRERPDSAGLRDAKGKTFFHVATEKASLRIVSYVCGNPSLDWIVSMQDNDGNTALHLAIQAQSFKVFCALFGHRDVNFNLINNEGETPLDLSASKVPWGQTYRLNSEDLIEMALLSVGASHGDVRSVWDKTDAKPQEEDRESERLKDASQKFIVASVLIETMAFGAAFAIPGGYRADGHPNAGTPTLATGYVFHAFIMATALSFICSSAATIGFIIAGVPWVSLTTRQFNFNLSVFFIWNSVTSMFAAFALGVYMVLAPVARHTAIAVCCITPVVLVVRDIPRILKMVILVQPILLQRGLFLGTLHLLGWVMQDMLLTLGPLVVTFGWAAVANIQWREIQSRQIVRGIGWFSMVIGCSLTFIIFGATLTMIQWRRLVFRASQWYRSI